VRWVQHLLRKAIVVPDDHTKEKGVWKCALGDLEKTTKSSSKSAQKS
jgi:hypothetical protein